MQVKTSRNNMSDEDYVYEESDEKRAHHNALEKKRRNYIRTSFEGLRAQMFSGKLGRGNSKSSRAIVLQAAKKLINRSRELSKPISKETKKAVIANSTKFYKKLTMLAEKIKRYNTSGAHNQEEMLRDYLTMSHMLRLMNGVPEDFLQLFAVEGVNKKPHVKREIEDDSDAEHEERLYQAQVGDLNLETTPEDDGKALKPYFKNNPAAFGLIFGRDDSQGYGPDSDSDSEQSGTEFVPRRKLPQVRTSSGSAPKVVARKIVNQAPPSPSNSDDSCSSLSPSPLNPPSTPEETSNPPTTSSASPTDKIYFPSFDEHYPLDLPADFVGSVPNSIFDDEDSLDLDSLLQCDQMSGALSAMWPNLAEDATMDHDLLLNDLVNDLLSDTGSGGRPFGDLNMLEGLFGGVGPEQRQPSDASSGEDFDGEDDDSSSSSGSDVDVESVPEDVNMFLNIHPKD